LYYGADSEQIAPFYFWSCGVYFDDDGDVEPACVPEVNKMYAPNQAKSQFNEYGDQEQILSSAFTC
jgi:hypothetical protein